MREFYVPSTLHNHTTFSDGKHTPREMIEAAVAAGMTDFGLSDHGLTPHDLRYCMQDEAAYLRELAALKAQYAGRIRVHTGVELDARCEKPQAGAYDYTIGSVHYYESDFGVYDVDGTAADTARALKELFCGDAMAMTKAYYRSVVSCIQKFRPDVIGHFDVLTKSNEEGRFFDEQDPAWQRIALEAAEACLPLGGVFEINTGAMARGRRSLPYPAPFLLKYLREKRAPITLSADCHDKTKLRYAFADTAQMLKSLGFTSCLVYADGRFEQQGL